MRLENKQIPYDHFVENIVVKRKLFTSGKVLYTAEFKMNNVAYSDTISYHINEPEDVPYYDNWAREQLTRKLLIQINKGK